MWHLPAPPWCQIHRGPSFLWRALPCMRNEDFNATVVHIQTQNMNFILQIPPVMDSWHFPPAFSELWEYSRLMKMWCQIHEINRHQWKKMLFWSQILYSISMLHTAITLTAGNVPGLDWFKVSCNINKAKWSSLWNIVLTYLVHHKIWIRYINTGACIFHLMKHKYIHRPSVLWDERVLVWWSTDLLSLLSSRVSFWDRSAVFYHLRRVHTALTSMQNVHWWRGLACLLHVFPLCRICPSFENTSPEPWHWRHFKYFNGRTYDHFGTGSNSWSSNENGFSAFSLLRFRHGTIGAQTQGVFWREQEANGVQYTRDISLGTVWIIWPSGC